jgi:hypothetical protein
MAYVKSLMVTEHCHHAPNVRSFELETDGSDCTVVIVGGYPQKVARHNFHQFAIRFHRYQRHPASFCLMAEHLFATANHTVRSEPDRMQPHCLLQKTERCDRHLVLACSTNENTEVQARKDRSSYSPDSFLAFANRRDASTRQRARLQTYSLW